MLNRRKFLKRVSGALVGFAAFLVMPSKKLPAKQKECIITNGMGEIREWHDKKGYHREFQTMDFSPDEVVGVDKYRGRLLVYCKHSIWEIEENCYGDGFQRKQLSCFGIRGKEQ